jgi:hypothetical protein
LVGGRKASINGHILATPVDKDITLSLPRSKFLSESGELLLSVTFVGKLDRWERILQEKTGDVYTLATVYKRIFEVNFDDLIKWIDLKKRTDPRNYRYVYINTNMDFK